MTVYSDNDDGDRATVAATMAARAVVGAHHGVGGGTRLVARDPSPHFAVARLGAAFAVKGATKRHYNGSMATVVA